MLRHAIFFALSLSFVNGCYVDRRPQLARQEASPLLGCPADLLYVRSLGRGSYAVEGCGRGVFVVCEQSAKHGTVCMIDDVPKVKTMEPLPEAPAKPMAFDPEEARLALERVHYGDCGNTGSAKLEVTFASTGTVAEVRVAEGSLAPSSESCVLDRFLGAKMNPFAGEQRKVRWGITLGPSQAPKPLPESPKPEPLPEGAIEI